MDWFGGELIITSDGWTILFRKPGLTLAEAQLELERWVKEHPGQQWQAMYHPYPTSMGIY